MSEKSISDMALYSEHQSMIANLIPNRFSTRIIAFAFSSGMFLTPSARAQDLVTLNPSITYQRMVGWEIPSIGTVRDFEGVRPFMATLADRAANELGANMANIEVSAGAEQPGTCINDYINATITENVFTGSCAYNSVNDNADPNVADLSKFQFSSVDYQIENVVLPLKRAVEARGEHLFIQLRYVDYKAATFEHWQNPAEYGEFMLVMFDHMQSKYGFVPDAIDTMNEPDLVPFWSSNAVGSVIAAAGPRLAAAGYHPAFHAPSTVDKGHAAPWMTEVLAVPGAAPFVKGLSWHCYSDVGTNSSAAIAAVAVQSNLYTMMTECWTSGNQYDFMHSELKNSRASTWQLALIHGGNGYYNVNTTTGQIDLRPKAQFIRQYYKYVRAGARRIDAVTPSTNFDPVAFINTDGKYVVVSKSLGAGSLSIKGLPAGTYGIFYTTGPDGLTVSQYDIHAADQVISAGQNLVTSIPAKGVITVFAKSGASPCDVNVDGSVNVTDVQLSVNQALGMVPCSADIDGSGSCNIVDVQRIVNSALGGQCIP